MIMKNLVTIACCVACTSLIESNTMAQTSSRAVVHLNSMQIDSAGSSKRTPDKPGRLLATGPAGERYLIVVRSGEGAVEAHEQYDDVAVIRAGHGLLRTGPKLEGSTLSGKAPEREWLGGTIPKATERRIGTGDFLVIPAGLAHQYVPDQGDSLVYFTVKVRQADQRGHKK
jgi:mannose-6-phosphate isomerase-like protein (cupin superfamily)